MVIPATLITSRQKTSILHREQPRGVPEALSTAHWLETNDNVVDVTMPRKGRRGRGRGEEKTEVYVIVLFFLRGK